MQQLTMQKSTSAFCSLDDYNYLNTFLTGLEFISCDFAHIP